MSASNPIDSSDRPRDRLERARDFILRHARLIDRYLFAYLFEGDAREPVIDALRAYRNSDGGFGNALEPDKRCPASQPVDGEVALALLDLVDGFEEPMVSDLCDWMAASATESGGLPFALPSVNDYPHAPWWKTPPDPPACINPTASIVGMLTRHGVEHPWLDLATGFCWRDLEAKTPTGFDDLRCAIAFLEHARDRGRAEALLEKVRAYLATSDEIAYERESSGYVHAPLDWAPLPRGFCHRLFSREVLAADLDALAGLQRADGGWPIGWQAISPGVELEWRGRVTVDALRTLHAYADAGFESQGLAPLVPG